MKSIVTITEDNEKKYRSYLKMKQRLSKMSRNTLVTEMVLGTVAVFANLFAIILFADSITGFMALGDIFFVLPAMELTIFGVSTISLRVKQRLYEKQFNKKYPDINMNLSEHYIEKLLLEYDYNLNNKDNELKNNDDNNFIESKPEDLTTNSSTRLTCGDSEYRQNIKNYWLKEISKQRNADVEKNKEKKLGTKK